MAGVHASPSEAFVIAQVFGGVRETAFEWNLAFRGVGVDQVGFGTDDVDDDVVVDIFFEFEKPFLGVRGKVGERGEGSTRSASR
jgi:hypothetical protein